MKNTFLDEHETHETHGRSVVPHQYCILFWLSTFYTSSNSINHKLYARCNYTTKDYYKLPVNIMMESIHCKNEQKRILKTKVTK